MKKGAKPEDTSSAFPLEQDISQKARIPVGHLIPPGSIEQMEAEGQKQLVASESIPFRIMGNRVQAEALLIKWGFDLGPQHDQDKLFRWAKLPAGWKKRDTEHSLWSKIVDKEDRERVSIFYKAAFYDRDAFMSLVPRYICNYLSREDVASLGSSTVGHDVIRCKEAVGEKLIGYVVVDNKTGEKLISFVGSDFDEVGTKASAFVRERFGNESSDPARWDDP